MSDFFSIIAAEKNLRDQFASEVKKIIDQYNLDGVDIDWEFPGAKKYYDADDRVTWMNTDSSKRKADLYNYPKLLSAVRRAIGPGKILGTAVIGNPLKYPKELGISMADLKQIYREVAGTVDTVGIMTYDVSGQFDSVARHHTSLSGDGSDIYVNVMVQTYRYLGFRLLK